MRKTISLGLCALMFLLFSGQLFAGNADACDPLKYDRSKPGLYGLCNAWYNADEEDKAKIAELYWKKSGGSKVPGSDTFSCVCWDDLSYDAVCAIANSEDARVVKGDNATTIIELPVVTQFGADSGSCTSWIFDTTPVTGGFNRWVQEFANTSLDFDAFTCISEVELIADMEGNTLLCP